MTSNVMTASTNDVNLTSQQQQNQQQSNFTLDNRFNEDEGKNCQGKSKKVSWKDHYLKFDAFEADIFENLN